MISMADFVAYVKEIQQGSSTLAFHHLVQLFEHKVFTLCYRIIGSREEAEEAAQDVFLKCYRSITKLEDPEKFPQWLMKIAYTKAIDYVRKKKVHKVGIEEVKEIQGDVNVKSRMSLDDSDLLEKALTQLNPYDTTIINLYYQEDMPVKEISTLMSLSESNVKIRLHRSREAIREMLLADTIKGPKR